MMSKTHITIGIASALAITAITSDPVTPASCLPAIAGGAIGGILCDIDVKESFTDNPNARFVKYRHDASIGRLIALGIATVVVIIDILTKSLMSTYINEHHGFGFVIGIVIFVIEIIAAILSSHRTFAHSFLAMILFTLAVFLFCRPATISFAAAFFSHIFMDLFNKQRIRLFFPLGAKGICFKLCYASGVANTALMWIGLGLSVILLIYCIV